MAGKNRVAMADLVAILAGAGCRDVRTYIQSGNVVYRAPGALARRVGRVVSEALSGRFGLTVPVVTRTAGELETIVADNPLLRAGAFPDTLHLAFLADRPTAARVAALDPRRSPPDTFEVRGREVYLCCPNGYGRTKMTNDWFDRQLATTSTVRNWRTVLTLLEMVRQGASPRTSAGRTRARR